MSLNKVMAIGRLGKDGELQYSPKGEARISFSLAVDSFSKGEKTTEWMNVIHFGDSAERLQEYLTKGTQVFIEGRLQTRSWESDGQKHYRTEVIAYNIQLLSKKEAPSAPKQDFDDLPFA